MQIIGARVDDDSAQLRFGQKLQGFISVGTPVFNSSVSGEEFHSNTRRGKAQLNSLLARRVRCSCREPRLTVSKTEPNSPSRPPAPERTNTNRSLNMKTEKNV